MLGVLSNDEIISVLKSNSIGRVGCTDGNRIYVVPVTYAYDGKYIIAHSRPGLKTDMMRSHPEVCFEVDKIITLTNWKSVVAWGTYEEIEDAEEKKNAMMFFINSVLHLEISESAVLHHDLPSKSAQPHEAGVIPTIVYRILLKEMTGRFELK